MSSPCVKRPKSNYNIISKQKLNKENKIDESASNISGVPQFIDFSQVDK